VAFVFRVTSIRLVEADSVGILEGQLLSGHVKADTDAELLCTDSNVPLHISGVVLDLSDPKKMVLKLKACLKQAAMSLVQKGDFIVKT